MKLALALETALVSEVGPGQTGDPGPGPDTQRLRSRLAGNRKQVIVMHLHTAYVYVFTRVFPGDADIFTYVFRMLYN